MPIFDTYVRSPFRFYDRLEKQHRYLLEANDPAVDCLYKLITPEDNKLLPFMIKRAHTGLTTVQFKIVAVSGGAITTVNPALVTMISTADFDYLIYNGDDIGSSLTCNAYYYAYVQDSSNNRWYSEVFYVTGTDVQCYCKLEWTNSCDFADVYYAGGFTHRLYLDPQADVIQREATITRESKKNGQLEEVVSLQRFAPSHIIETGLIPDYLKDALDFMVLHNSINLTMKHKNGTGEIKNVQISGKWEFDASYFNGTIKFEEAAIVKVECCEELEVTNVCHTSCHDAYEDPGSGWVIGRYYMNSDGRLKEYTGSGFIYHFCNSKIAHNPTTNSDWCYDENTQAWYPMPFITYLGPNANGTALLIKAIAAPGSIITLTIDATQEAQLTSEIFSTVGFEFPANPGDTYEFIVSAASSSPSCNYGTADPINYEMPATKLITPYHAMQRQFNSGDTNTFTISSIKCNGVEQLGSSLTLNLNTTNITYSLGLDGNLHLDQIDDAINAHLLPGYKCHDDMRLMEFPAGESFHFIIHLHVVGVAGTWDYDYVYDSVTGVTGM